MFLIAPLQQKVSEKANMLRLYHTEVKYIFGDIEGSILNLGIAARESFWAFLEES